MLEIKKNCHGISAEYLLALPTSWTALTPLLNLATKQRQRKHQYSCWKQKPLLTVFALALLDLILIPHRLVAWLAVEPGSEAANTSIWKYIKHYSPPLWTDFVSGFCQLSMVTFQQSAVSSEIIRSLEHFPVTILYCHYKRRGLDMSGWRGILDFWRRMTSRLKEFNTSRLAAATKEVCQQRTLHDT